MTKGSRLRRVRSRRCSVADTICFRLYGCVSSCRMRPVTLTHRRPMISWIMSGL
ncbi:hypothetical protein GBA52_025387 [Prunus armeniaca]|nr:hypothetical protein GBA52_025387 [Prunus armeniaca]